MKIIASQAKSLPEIVLQSKQIETQIETTKSNIKPIKIQNNPTNTKHNKERLELYTLIVLRTAKQLWQNNKILENKNKNPESESETSHRCLITVPLEIKTQLHS